MKIAFLSYYSGCVYRGVETYVHELANALVKKSVDCTVYQSGPALSDSLYQVSPYTHKDNLPSISSDIDVLISNTGRKSAIQARLWALRHHIPMLIPGHSGFGFDDKLNLWLQPTRFIALTQFQKDWAKKQNSFAKVALISDGVNIQKFNPNIKPINLNIKSPVVLYTAAFVPMKRHELLIKAMANVSATLLLAGAGELHQDIKALCEKYIPGRFLIQAFKPEDMPSVYNAADIFTYPTSDWEASGLSLYEALASNLAIVANNDPVRREIIGDAGIYIDPANTSAYSNALTEALAKRWAHVPRHIAEDYSWTRIADQYIKLFTALK